MNTRMASYSVYAMDFGENACISLFGNNHLGAEEFSAMIVTCVEKHNNLDTIVVVLEATSVYSVHISNFLATSEIPMPYMQPYQPQGHG